MKSTGNRRAWLCTLGFLLAGIAWGQGDDASAGERLFHLHCADCHGVDGAGGRGPDLTRGAYRHGSTDDALLQTIAKGVAGTPMPATSLPDPQLRHIIRYIRALTGAFRQPVSGNAAVGEKLFRGKGICTKCHMVRGEGGNLGPDLTYIGSLRSPAHLRTSILAPEKEIDPQYWSVDAVANDGTAYSGIRLNEDTYIIQIIDTNENLRSLAKNDLRSLTIVKGKSRMPSYTGVFTDSELDDVVAFLYSLERTQKLP
jgi:putative heme-binding domain-containing protein